MEKNIKKISLLSLGVISITSLPIASISCNSNSVTNNQFHFSDGNINSFSNLEAKILNHEKRNLNNEVYETNITQRFGNQFKYPSWNYNYKENNNYIQIINGEEVNAFDFVMNEKASYVDDSGATVEAIYSDPNFILSEIKNNKLKKHPAALTQYKKNVSDNEMAVNKYFSIPTKVRGITSLGLFAPAGEVITLQFTKETLNSLIQQNVNNIEIIINSGFWNTSTDFNDSGRMSTRYPYIKTIFTINNLNELKTNNGIFKFGSPFGGSISIKVNRNIKSSASNLFYESYDNLKLNVKGATEILSYFHGVTTKEEWNDQIARINNNELTSPMMSIDFAYASMNLASTGTNVNEKGIETPIFGKKNLNEIIYPFEIVEKWTSFLFFSEYFASRDIRNDVTKIDFEVCDDIWGGAAAWGGGNIFYINNDWAGGAFLSGIEKPWIIKNNWGVFHEINHNFSQDAALFMRRTHGETNIVTLTALSLLNDGGRWRNILNLTSEFETAGWVWLENMYSTIAEIITKKDSNGNLVKRDPSEYRPKNEYSLQAILLYLLGTYNFTNYIRYDINTHPNDGGFNEIVELSDFFKLDFWPAFENFFPIWSDNEADSNGNVLNHNRQPASYEEASEEQKREIDRLRSSYKSFDFIGNIYACGTYLYNNETGEYDYTNDTQAPYQIVAGKDYTLDFEHGLDWVNTNFSWSKLEFNSVTKSGAKLSLDPTNNKKLIYKPNINAIDQIDEFDVAIIPDNFKNKPSNYVSKYKWKIKIRQVINEPIVSIYKDPHTPNGENNVNNKFSEDVKNYLQNPDNILYETIWNPDEPFLSTDYASNSWNRTKVSFTFIAPETGEYQFNIRTKGKAYISLNNEKEAWWFSDIQLNNQNNNSEAKIIDQTLSLEKDQPIIFDIYLTNSYWSQKSMLKFNAINLNNNHTFNVINYAISPYAHNLSNNVSEFLYDPKYKYKNRTINYNEFNTDLFGLNAPREVLYIDKENYVFNNYVSNGGQNGSKDVDKKLKNKDRNIFEDWSNSEPFDFSVDVDFNKHSQIGGLVVHHRLDNHFNGRPTDVEIILNGKTIYKDKYGVKFNDRGKDQSLILFNQVFDIPEQSKMTIKFINTAYRCITLDAIEFIGEKVYEVNRIIPIQDPNINFSNNWKLLTSDPAINVSDVNNSYILSNKKDDYIEFNLFAQSFDIIGQRKLENSIFDLYINDKLVATIDTANNSRIDNAILYSYSSQKPEGELFKIKIVNKLDKPLVIDYFQTYGNNVYTKKQ